MLIGMINFILFTKLHKTSIMSFPNVFIGNPFVENRLKSWIPAFAGMTLL